MNYTFTGTNHYSMFTWGVPFKDKTYFKKSIFGVFYKIVFKRKYDKICLQKLIRHVISPSNRKPDFYILCLGTDQPIVWNPNHSKSVSQTIWYMNVFGIRAPTVFEKLSTKYLIFVNNKRLNMVDVITKLGSICEYECPAQAPQ